MDCQRVRDQQIVGKYLKEQLPEEQVRAFEEHYFDCDACFGQLQLEHGAAVQARRIDPETDRPRTGWFASYRVVAAAAAAVILLMLLPVYFWISTGNSDDRAIEDVLASLAAVEEVPPLPDFLLRGADAVAPDDAAERAKRHYQAGRFREAATEFETILASDPTNKPASFYLGVSLLMTDDAEGAAAAFKRTLDREGGAFRELSHWYLAKAYLRLERMEEFERELAAVARMGGSYQRQAQEALEALEGARLH